MSDDVVSELEHDHVGLTQLVAELRGLVVSLVRAGAAVDALHPRLLDLVLELQGELVEHFAEEEEGLFPFLAERRPELGAAIEDLARNHDAICGTATRLAALAERGPAALGASLHQFEALFQRLDAAYEAHAAAELRFLRAAGAGLDEGERRALAERLRGLYG